VDDLDLVLEFAASFLKQAGYEVLTATSADAALKLLSEQTEPVDLLFTDYTMPGQNGWQLIQTARERWPKMRCLLASGYIDDAERAEMAQCARLRILNKPYDISEATKAIAEVLEEPFQG
jgi:DNA-binding NtrC family response regulator